MYESITKKSDKNKIDKIIVEKEKKKCALKVKKCYPDMHKGIESIKTNCDKILFHVLNYSLLKCQW